MYNSTMHSALKKCVDSMLHSANCFLCVVQEKMLWELLSPDAMRMSKSLGGKMVRKHIEYRNT